jgi:hypothetical protein
MDKLFEHTLLSIAGAAFLYFAYWSWKDVKKEKRPEVTAEMVDDAFNQMLEDNGYILEDDD